MIIKKVIIDNPKLFLDLLLRELIDNNINYCLINYDSYMEIHFDKYIYQILDLKVYSNFIVNDKELLQMPKHNISKLKTGYKKYTKSDIKNENKKAKIKRR